MVGEHGDMAQADLRRIARIVAKIAECQDELREAIIAAHASGETYRDIARAAGLSHQRVWQIANRPPRS